jgi:HNH endonuclease
MHPQSRTVDHIIPISKGGKWDHRNMVHCCRQCNALKADRMPEEFLAYVNELINDKKYMSYKVENFLLISVNTANLIKKINKYRTELAWPKTA